MLLAVEIITHHILPKTLMALMHHFQGPFLLLFEVANGLSLMLHELPTNTFKNILNFRTTESETNIFVEGEIILELLFFQHPYQVHY